MQTQHLRIGALVCLLVCLRPALVWGAPVVRNLIANGGFEEDNHNLRGEKMSCPVRERVTYGQSDSLPDRWGFDPQQPARVREGHSGQYAAILKAPAKISQSFTYAVQVKSGPPLPPLELSAWTKSPDGAGKLIAEIALTATVKGPGGQAQQVPIESFKKELPATGEWKKVTMSLSAEDILVHAATKPQPLGLIRGSVSFSHAGPGPIHIDDVALTTPGQAPPYTLVENAGFESIDAGGYPSQWSPARKSLRYFGSNYYVWRDWYHFLGKPRGQQAIDKLVVAAGAHSLRLNVPPGDDKHVETAAIALNQAEPRRMIVRFDYNSYLLANLMVQLVDDQGREVFAENVVPGTTGSWQTYCAEFQPRKAALKAGDVRAGGDLFGASGDALALKSCRLRIGVKGVNGSEMDDINQWVNVNHGGVLWIDNVVVAETESSQEDLAARGAKPQPIDTSPPALAVESIDLGERLFGDNVASVTLVNHGPQPASGLIELAITGPYREMDPKKAGYAVGAPEQLTLDQQPLGKPQSASASFTVAANARSTVALPYSIAVLLTDWRSEYRATFSLNGAESEMPLGTWSQQVLVDVERCYAFPEFTKQPITLNIGVAKKTLDRVNRLHLDVRRARDGYVVLATDQADFPQRAAAFNLQPLPPNFEGDSTNFVLMEVAIDSLPVHPQTKPVRDHYIVVQGLDASGAVVFEGRSARFGRMEAHTEKLDAISEVRIDPGNYLLVNGKPLFCRGHIWMQQNFGPMPLARLNTNWKQYGFNIKAGTQFPLQESSTADPALSPGVNELWSAHNTYLGSQMIAQKGPLSGTTTADIQKWLGKPNVVGIHFVPWEGEPSGDTQENFLAYAKAVKGAIGTRPLWISAGWFAPRVNGVMEPCYLEHDWYAPENNAYFQPSQLDKEILSNKGGQPCVLATYPNVFNDTPWLVQRFEHWTEILRHHTGLMQIGKPGDPTLMAGMNGEFRFIESFLFSKDAAPAVRVSPKVEHLVRSTPKANYIMATNAGPVIGGDWVWNTSLRDKGRASHTGSALWSRLHDFMRDYYAHFYKDDQPIVVKRGDKIIQYVYVPADSRAESLVLMARGGGQWRYHGVWGNFDHQAFTDNGVRMWLAKDMHQMSWGSLAIGFCGPEGHNPKHPALLAHTFTAEQFHNLGPLPPKDTWVRLEIPVEAIGLDGRALDGFAFISKGGRVWWERTIVVRDGIEEVVCDGSVGPPPSALRKVRFDVAGLRAGTKINVCFDEREIVAGDGYFEDDLSGEPGYRNLWVGLYGDKLGETGYYGDGLFYNYNWGKVAARLYELPK